MTEETLDKIRKNIPDHTIESYRTSRFKHSIIESISIDGIPMIKQIWINVGENVAKDIELHNLKLDDTLEELLVLFATEEIQKYLANKKA